ncbi:MAG TPA: hypothetical protein VII29_02815 [Terriglobales bacterium]
MSQFLHRSALTQTFIGALLFAIAAGTALAQQNVGELFASDASVKGSVVLANSGTTVMSGSSIAAGAQSATLKLERGGSMIICPGTNLAITTSQNGRQLMFSMDTGNIEMDYPIGAAADNLLTPDFRLLLPGPGRLHIAVRVNPKGDTCVQSLPSNSSAIVISEGMGEASYQVKPNEAVIFNGGRISGAAPTRESCGCPAPPPTPVAKVTPPPPQPETPKSDPPPPETHMVVDAPFIYRAEDPVDLTENVAHLKMESKPIYLDPVVLPPPATAAKSSKPAHTEVTTSGQKATQEKHGFFAKLSSFFASIFH